MDGQQSTPPSGLDGEPNGPSLLTGEAEPGPGIRRDPVEADSSTDGASPGTNRAGSDTAGADSGTVGPGSDTAGAGSSAVGADSGTAGAGSGTNGAAATAGTGEARPSARPSPAGPGPIDDLVPSADLLMTWVERTVREGIRRPGSAAGRRVENWIADQLRDLGVQDVRLEPVQVTTWEAGPATLQVWPAAPPHPATSQPDPGASRPDLGMAQPDPGASRPDSGTGDAGPGRPQAGSETTGSGTTQPDPGMTTQPGPGTGPIVLRGFALPHTRPVTGLEAELAWFGEPPGPDGEGGSAGEPAPSAAGTPEDAAPDSAIPNNIDLPDTDSPGTVPPGGGMQNDGQPANGQPGERLDGASGGSGENDDGEDAEEDAENGGVRGRIAVEWVDIARLVQADILPLATAVHDPSGEFAHLVQDLPFGPRGQATADAAMAAGAAAYIGVLAGMPWDTCDYYVPYDGVFRDIPAMWLRGSDGRRLARMLAAGPVRGRVDIQAERGTGLSHNVIGTLPGASDQWVIIASHHDAPWASAVEDASGVALVLAQAAYWTRVPAEQRPHNLMFLLTAGHMVHAAGTAAFIERHRDLLDRVVLEVHLEHAAARAVPDGAGGLVATGDPEVRWWFTSRDEELERSVAAAIAAEDLHRSLVLPPDAFMEHPPTDGGFFHLAGVPLMNFLTAPVYLFDSADTVDKVHRPSLEPVTRAVIRIINDLAGKSR